MNLRLTPRWRRALIAGGVVFCALVFISTFGFSFWFVLVEGRNLGGGKPDPAMRKTPVALKDLSVSTAPGRKLSYLGYQFEVPWNDLDEQKTKLVRSWQLVSFQSGKSIIFYTASPDGLLNTVSATTGRDSKALKRFYGAASDYAFTRAMLETTPDDIRLLTPRGEAARKISLLLLKSFDLTAKHGGSGIFVIQTSDFRGFQYGDPASHPPEVRVDLYSDKVQLHFVFPQKEGSVDISQAEINRVIQTVRPIAGAPIKEQ
jgi:hypothetical protein